MIAKDGDLECEEIKEFARAEPCYRCMRRPPSEPQHWPPRGRGVTRDDKIYPTCRDCHDAAHFGRVINGERVFEKPTDRQQDELVTRFRLRFMEAASSTQFEGYARARRAWLEKRGIPY